MSAMGRKQTFALAPKWVDHGRSALSALPSAEAVECTLDNAANPIDGH
jgi:hypothetical protein